MAPAGHDRSMRWAWIFAFSSWACVPGPPTPGPLRLLGGFEDAAAQIDAGAVVADSGLAADLGLDSGLAADSGLALDAGLTPDSGLTLDAGLTADSGLAADAGIAEAPDTGVTVPLFVAQGSMGRTIVSCDDGRTWVGDHSWDNDGAPFLCGSPAPKRCWVDTCSYSLEGQCVAAECCNDTPDESKGVVYGDGKFVGTWGWGRPGALGASTDGLSWTLSPGDTYGGIAFGGGRFIAASRAPVWSSDGVHWQPTDPADFRGPDGGALWSVRSFAYGPYQGGGRFIAVATGAGRDILISSDGQRWWRPTQIPAGCGEDTFFYGSILGGNDVFVIVGESGNACRSTDGGLTWTMVPTGLSAIYSHGVWTGSAFQFWGDDAFMVSSSDGLNWQKTRMTTPMRIGPVARSDSGTYVALGSVWAGYENQEFLRSSDGLRWQPADAAVLGHPIFHLTFGAAAPSTLCPGP